MRKIIFILGRAVEYSDYNNGTYYYDGMEFMMAYQVHEYIKSKMA
jgi:hypothetical protein